MAMSDVDGALVGRATLTADSITIITGGEAVLTLLQSGTQPKELTVCEYVTIKNVLGKSLVWSTKDDCLY